MLHLAFPSEILSFCFLHFAKFLFIHSSYFQLPKFHLYYDFSWRPINPEPVAFSESVSQSIKWKQSCFLSSTQMWIPPHPWLTHILSPPLAVRISEGLWPELSKDILGMCMFYLSCQSRWDCLGLFSVTLSQRMSQKHIFYSCSYFQESGNKSSHPQRGERKERERQMACCPAVSWLSPRASISQVGRPHIMVNTVGGHSWGSDETPATQRLRLWQQTDYSVHHKSHVSLIPLTPPWCLFSWWNIILQGQLADGLWNLQDELQWVL